jgi:hypothetical protein
MATRGASWAVACPGGVLGTVHQASVGGTILPRREAGAVMAVGAADQPAERADTGHRPEPVAGVGVGLRGRGEDRPRQVPEQRVVVATQRAVHVEALVPCGIGAALRAPSVSSPTTLGGGGGLHQYQHPTADGRDSGALRLCSLVSGVG